METSLLTTKLNIPPTRSQLVVRPNLYKRLQEGFNYKLILVSAPAGFGKTTLLSEWIHGSKPPIRTAWVSLDEGDNDPVRFWDYFITALQIVKPDCGEKILPLLHSSPQPSVEPILTALINNLAATVGDFAVVLDDYHLIEIQSIHDGITYLIEHLPAGMHLILATRADPPLPLAHFRGRGILMEIGADDLRFNLEDAARLFKELNTPEISMEDVVALNERTEGWAVGLKMAALSMSGQKDISGFITTFTGSHRYVMDYLMEEVLQKQIPELREFLYKTSVLKRLTASLCDAVTGRKDSQTVLIQLELGHLFIVPLDETRQWYRYEHLFSDLLRHQCQTAYGMEKMATLHRQASQWYEDNNLPDDAIHHALEAKDWETSMRLIYNRCEELRKQVQFDTLLGWLEKIPEEVLRSNPRLYSQYASYLTVVSRFNAAEAALSYLASTAYDDANLRGEAAFALANIARIRGDFLRCIDMAEKALSVLPPDSIAMRSRANFIIGFILYDSGRFYEAEKYLTSASELGQQVKEIATTASSMVYLGSIAHFNGRLRRAIDIYKKTLEFARQTQLGSGVGTFLGKAYYELNNLEEAAENVRLSIEMGERGGLAEGRLISYFVKARILLAQGNETEAAAAMEKMDETSHHPTVSASYKARHAACRIIFSIRYDDLGAATNWGRKLAEYPDILHLEYQYAPGRLLVAQGKKEQAAEYLRDLHTRLIRADAHGLDIAVRVCQALAAETEEAALEFLSDALNKGEPEGFVRSFVDEGKLIKPMLRKALARGITPEYTRKLLTIIATEEQQKQKKKGAPTLLTRRESEILRLLAEELPNKQIADRLNISLSTVKTHLHNILGKMNAKNRIQAISNAKDLQLI